MTQRIAPIELGPGRFTPDFETIHAILGNQVQAHGREPGLPTNSYALCRYALMLCGYSSTTAVTISQEAKSAPVVIRTLELGKEARSDDNYDFLAGLVCTNPAFGAWYWRETVIALVDGEWSVGVGVHDNVNLRVQQNYPGLPEMVPERRQSMQNALAQFSLEVGLMRVDTELARIVSMLPESADGLS